MAPSGQDWFSVGRTSTFPNIGVDEDTQDLKQLCKAFHVPPGDSSKATQIREPSASCDADGEEGKLHEQVIVFRYKGKFHAIDHVRAHGLPSIKSLSANLVTLQQCPHNSYPLSEGSVFDIEDFGIVLSAGITCPEHGWSFDLFTGNADHGRYQLKVWEVELREGTSSNADPKDEDKEVWVRRKGVPGRSSNGRIG